MINILTELTMWLFFISFIAAIVSSVFAVRLLKKHGVRSIKDNFIWVGNLLNMEHDLKKLSKSSDDPLIMKTLKRIQYFKYSGVINLVLFIVLAVWGANK